MFPSRCRGVKGILERASSFLTEGVPLLFLKGPPVSADNFAMSRIGRSRESSERMKHAFDARGALLSLALYVALSFAIPSSARGASARLDDPEASVRITEMQRTGVLRDPFWGHAYWVRAQSAPNRASKVADLRWALRFDPELQRARYELAYHLMLNRDPECATHLFDAALRLGQSFPAQQSAALLLLTLGGGVSLAVLVLCALFAVGRAIPPTRHAISEKLGFLPPEVRPAATILTLGAPLLVVVTLPPTSAIFWLLVLGSAGGWTLFAPVERRVVSWAIVGILLAPWGVGLWTRLLEPSYPNSYSRLLWEAQSSLDPVAIDGLLRLPDSGSVVDANHLTTLALVARRQGDFASAAANLEEAIRLRPGSWGEANNLGNVRLLAGDPDGALAAYAKARRLAPEEPVIRVNEAQAWMRKFEFPRANESLEQAKKLGYHFPEATSISVDETILVEDTLEATDLWKTFLRDIDSPRVLGWDKAWEMTLSILLPLRPFLLCIPLFAALFYATQARNLPRIHTCASCGKTVCRKCHYRVQRRSMCGDCYAIRQRVRAPIQREEELCARRRVVRRSSWIVGFILAVAVPGAGHLLEGRRRPAMALLFLWVAWLVLARGDASAVGPWQSIVRAVPYILVLVSVAGYIRLASRSSGVRSDDLARSV